MSGRETFCLLLAIGHIKDIQNIVTFSGNAAMDSVPTFSTVIGVVALIFLIYIVWRLTTRSSCSACGISTFVPFNATEAPDVLNPNQWKSVNDRFGTLLQSVNSSTFALSYRMHDMLSALSSVLEAVAPGKYTIISVGDQQYFALRDVLIQEVETLAMVKFASVDFVLQSMNPFLIQKVVLTLDKRYSNSQDVKPMGESIGHEPFRLRNPLHLFYPYNTSDNTMVITTTDVDAANDKIAYLAAERSS